MLSCQDKYNDPSPWCNSVRVGSGGRLMDSGLICAEHLGILILPLV